MFGLVAQSVELRTFNSERDEATSTEEPETSQIDDPAQVPSAHTGPPAATSLPASDAVEAALAYAIRGAVDAGEWEKVGQLTRELEARRLARAGNVVAIDTRRPRRGGGK